VNLLNNVREMINGLQHPSPKKKERLIPFLNRKEVTSGPPSQKNLMKTMMMTTIKPVDPFICQDLPSVVIEGAITISA